MAGFIVVWPYALTTKLSCLQKNNFGHTKGQLISKGLLSSFNSSKKRRKNFCPSRLGQKLNISSSFFGRIEVTKISLRD